MTARFTGNADIYGRKYCSGCRMHQEQEGGMIKQTRATQRWVCSHCAKRMQASGFSAKRRLAQDDDA